jgi:23S rRNA (cytidine1920-2'-O)/16S rRNA (cytidine1409-2'-O)-methyltransferase
MAGIVLVNERRIEKPSDTILPTDEIRLKNDPASAKYVGRGGLKLEGALAKFDIRPHRYNCLDIGASTGGFTDCLLQHGAEVVYAIDVGTNQLEWKIRNDPRVIVRENANARYLSETDFPLKFDLITMDVSFISIKKILPALIPLLKKTGRIIALIKPQFEVKKGDVGKGGIVTDSKKHTEVTADCIEFASNLGLKNTGLTESPITGAEGNKEFLAIFEIRNK